MNEFLSALAKYEFMQHAMLGGLLASVASGVVGTYVVIRRISYLAGGIAHSVLGGMGLAGYLNHVCGWTWLEPLYGAVAAALVSAVLIGIVSLKSKEREDTVIGAMWAVGMAVGVIFIYATPGYSQNLSSYLFGNVLMISSADLWLIGLLDILVVAVGMTFYHQLAAVCFDAEFARVRGLNVEFYYILLLCLTALTVVILATVVGVVMVIALLTLPVAAAGRFCHSLGRTMIVASGLSMAVVTLGLAVSYTMDFPTGAAIIVVAAFVYVIAIGLTRGQA